MALRVYCHPNSIHVAKKNDAEKVWNFGWIRLLMDFLKNSYRKYIKEEINYSFVEEKSLWLAILVWKASLSNIHLPMTREFPWLIIMQIAISAEWYWLRTWMKSNVHLHWHFFACIHLILLSTFRVCLWMTTVPSKFNSFSIKIVGLQNSRWTWLLELKNLESRAACQQAKSFISDFWRLVTRTVMLCSRCICSTVFQLLTRPRRKHLTNNRILQKMCRKRYATRQK